MPCSDAFARGAEVPGQVQLRGGVHSEPDQHDTAAKPVDGRPVVARAGEHQGEDGSEDDEDSGDLGQREQPGPQCRPGLLGRQGTHG